MDISGKIAFVTGAASGIGRAFADECVRRGAVTLIADIDENALRETAAALEAKGGKVKAYRLDVSNRENYEGVAQAVLEEFGAPYLLFNNAGVAWKAAASQATVADWEWLTRVNILGAGYGLALFVPKMVDAEQGGYIVNTGSITGLIASPGITAVYGMTKHAVVAISEALAHELRSYGIHVAVVCPGQVATNIVNSDRNLPEFVKAEALSESIPEEREFSSSLVAQGLTPARVAEQVFAALEEKRNYVITHPEYRQEIITRHRQIEQAIRGEDATDVPLLTMARDALNLQPLT